MTTGNEVAGRLAAMSAIAICLHRRKAVSAVVLVLAGCSTSAPTPNLQALIDATPPMGTLTLEARTYTITTRLVRSTPIRIVGSGTMYGGTVIRQASPDTDAFAVTADVLAAYDDRGSDNARNYEQASVFENLRIEGPAGSTKGAGIYGLTDLQLTDVTVSGFADGIFLDHHAYFSSIDRVRVTGATHAGLWFRGGNNLTVTRSQFWANEVGLLASDFLSLRVRDGVFEQNGAGISADGTSRSLVIDGNYFEETAVGAPDISIGAVTDVMIASNYFQDDAQGSTLPSWHIDLHGAADVTVTTNSLSGRVRCGETRVVFVDQPGVSC